VKLLFDANLSHRLVVLLSDLFPGSVHVSQVALERAADQEVLDHAVENDFIVVSKDEDLHQLALLQGPPLKVVWVRLGNCTTSDVEAALRTGAGRIERLEADDDATFLVLSEASG